MFGRHATDWIGYSLQQTNNLVMNTKLISVVASGIMWILSSRMPLTYADAPRVTRPNIILFLVDDMGWTDCGAYGSKYYDTPNMDRFASQAMRFTQAYSQPLCSPTRASLLTGQYSARHGITSATGHLPPQPDGFEFLPKSGPANRALLMPESKNFLEPSQYTLAEALRDAGYRTGHVGKWHLGSTEPHWPEKQGFQVAFHCHPDPGPPGQYFSPYGVIMPNSDVANETGKRSLLGTITDGPPGEYITDRLTEEAVKFIEAEKSKPFFLNVWHYGVHGPWGHKEKITEAMSHRIDPTGRQNNPVMASMLKSVDESLGRVMDKLDELKISEHTIVLFMSDNGGNTHSMTQEDDARRPQRDRNNPIVASYRKWAGYKPPTNNAPLREGKGTLYEGGTRVPLMVRWPGRIAPGSTSNAIVGCIDVYPTLMELAGLAIPAAQRVDGVSYANVLMGTGAISRDAYFIWFPHLAPGVSVRQGDWKLIRRLEEQPGRFDESRELYHLQDDIGETKNLASSMPDKVKQLDALIDRFVANTGALYPRPNPEYKKRSGTSSDKELDPKLGLVPRFCKAMVADGVLRIAAQGRTPFLGTSQIKGQGPFTMKLRARTTSGGIGHVRWVTKDQEDFPASGQTIDFVLAAGNEWQDITAEVPADGQVRILRLYLPAEKADVEIESIQFISQTKQSKTWSFLNTEK